MVPIRLWAMVVIISGLNPKRTFLENKFRDVPPVFTVSDQAERLSPYQNPSGIALRRTVASLGQQCVEQDLTAGGAIFFAGMLDFVVADAVDAGNENH